MNNFFNSLTSISEKEANLINPQVLAFVGDSVHTLFVRTKISINSDNKSGKLHSLANKFIKASAQSEIIEKITKMLSENEIAIFKRARNYKTQSVAKNSSVIDYKRATGFEAVLGYLYLTGNFERLNLILNESFNVIEFQGNTSENN